MKSEDLYKLRRETFKETRQQFSERTGVSVRTLQRMESGQSEIPLVLGLAIAARLYGLPPWGFPKIEDQDGEKS